jgi:hypothetical protein
MSNLDREASPRDEHRDRPEPFAYGSDREAD